MRIMMNRRHAMAALALVAAFGLTPRQLHADEAVKATLYKNPQCGCCEEYAKYLGRNGFAVTVVESFDLPSVKRQNGVPEALEGCHTTIIGGYAIEGHIPVATIKRLLSEKPSIKGISLPGMPQGSPGMMGEKAGPFTIYEISGGEPKVYATE